MGPRSFSRERYSLSDLVWGLLRKDEDDGGRKSHQATPQNEIEVLELTAVGAGDVFYLQRGEIALLGCFRKNEAGG